MRMVILGLSVTSSWGNGHATNFRALMRALERRGHDVLFLERDVPWYASRRDLPQPPWGSTRLYCTLDELRRRHAAAVREADVVIVGSYVPDGVAVGEWVLQTTTGLAAFYDIDTPVTLAKLAQGDCAYLAPWLIPRYGLYLSFTSGPTLRRLERRYGSPCARAFHCFVDPEAYPALEREPRWDLGYLGTYSEDRQPGLEELLLEPARRDRSLRCVVAGAGYPDDLAWPANVEHIEHLAPPEHPGFYAQQRFTLSVTRADMLASGWSPSVRLFEAGACAVPVISDRWDGIEAFFVPGEEIEIADTGEDVRRLLGATVPAARREMGRRARRRILDEHTAEHRVLELERHLADLPTASRMIA